MKLRVSFCNNKDGTFEIYFIGLEHWDDFDLVLGLLQQENNCQILSNEDMIYLRKAELTWKIINFDLIQDDMLGNSIFTRNVDDVEALYQLALKVVNSVRLKLKELEDK